MSMLQWAENEIKLAIKDLDKKRDEPLVEIYLAALDVFKIMTEKSDLGVRYSLYAPVLQKLVDGTLLTPLTGNADEFTFAYSVDDKQVYQNKRWPLLFRIDTLDYDYDKGRDNSTFLYTDVNRSICINLNNSSETWHNGFVAKVIDKMFPITFPYMPTKPIEVICERFKTNKDGNGDYDMLSIKRVMFLDGTEQPINLYFVKKFGKWERVTEKEYNSFKSLSLGVKERSDKSESL